MFNKIHGFRFILPFKLILLLVISTPAWSSTGDTTIVHGFSGFLHQNCNTGNSTYLFPSDTNSYYRIMLNYKLDCPSFGCDIYDRIATLKVLRPTGTYDSTLTVNYYFSVSGTHPDSISWVNDTAYSYSYNSLTQQVDSTSISPITILVYGDSLQPTVATDTLSVWPLYYHNYIFDTNGIAIDSTLIDADSTLYQVYDSTYNVFEVKEPFEIARSITSYGMAMSVWFDVTDYRMLLADSVTLQSTVCGYSNGWLVTTDFYFIEGTPPLHASKITNLWNGTFPYGNTANPIENHLQPITLTPDSTTIREKIRLITTGHGFGGYPNQDVAEFYDVTHTLIINGTPYDQHLWRSDCGSNPLYPQGAPGYYSTWYYKRANWCPGSYVKPQDYDATSYLTSGGSFTVDYDMAPYTVTGGPSGFYAPEYYIQSQAIEYDNTGYTNNASIETILVPSGEFDGRRRNPICDGMNPVIRIRNAGNAVLQQLNITYFVDNGPVQNYIWTGSLNLLDSTTVELPPVSFAAGNHTFTAYISGPNGNADEYSYDDTLQTSFTTTNVYNTNFIRIQMKTDNSPNEISWTVKDENGSVLYSRNNFPSAGITYVDTIYLSNGCYSFTAYDSFGDGVCCYNGAGFFRLLKGATGTIIATLGDYGDFYNVNLTIDYQNGIDELEENPLLFLFPNPASSLVHLNSSVENSDLKVIITDISGRVVLESDDLQIRAYNSEINVSNLNSGIYLLHAVIGSREVVKKIIVQK